MQSNEQRFGTASEFIFMRQKWRDLLAEIAVRAD